MIPIIFSAQKCEKFLPQRVDTCLYLHGLVHDKQVSDILYRDLAWLSPLAWLTFASPYNNQIKINPYLGVWSWQMLSAPSSPYVIILPFFRFFLISICHHRPKRMHGVGGGGRGWQGDTFPLLQIHTNSCRKSTHLSKIMNISIHPTFQCLSTLKSLGLRIKNIVKTIIHFDMISWVIIIHALA